MSVPLRCYESARMLCVRALLNPSRLSLGAVSRLLSDGRPSDLKPVNKTKELEGQSTSDVVGKPLHPVPLRRIRRQEEPSVEDHDPSRVTDVGRRLQRKADSIFDQLAMTRGANKQTFLMAINVYLNQETLYRRGAVEFIYSGLQRMTDFGVEKDLMAYKALIQAFPEGKMIPRNVWQVEFMHYPRHQQCCIDLLEQMENNRLIPDDEFGLLLKNRFGKAAHATRKYYRMRYWLPKFKHMNPYPIPQELPNDPVQLALTALRRMCVDVDTDYKVYQTSEMGFDSEEDTFIASAQSPTQQELIQKHKTDNPLFVEGPHWVHLQSKAQQYFLLRAEPNLESLERQKQFEKNQDSDTNLFQWTGYMEEEECREIRPILSVHEQEDGTVLGMCITGSSTKSSILSWVRCLEKDNPQLIKIPILFKITSLGSDLEPARYINN